MVVMVAVAVLVAAMQVVMTGMLQLDRLEYWIFLDLKLLKRIHLNN